MIPDEDSQAGKPGHAGQRAAGATGGIGGAGGKGGEPGGTGGEGGSGGAVYIDSRLVARWVHSLGAGFVALALAMIIGFLLVAHEHDHRVKDNAHAIALIKQETANHSHDDATGAALSEKADCDRARDFSRIALANGYFNTPQGRADLIEFVRHASRIGCSLK